MAGKNQVTLTFAGDSKDLERTFSTVTDGAEKAEKSLDGIGGGVDRMNRRLDDGGKKAGEYSSRLDRAGESADDAETRFTGLASGIDGVTTLMDNPTPQEFAQGIADISDGLANAAVPALKRAKDAVMGFVDGIGGVKNLLIGGAVVGGVVALAAGIDAAREAANNKVLDSYAQQLERTGFAASEAARESLKTAEAAGVLDDIANRVAESGGAQAVERLIDLARESGLSTDSINMLNDKLDETGTTAERTADNISGINDALRALTDPVFAAINAQDQLNEAQGAYNEALAEHGARSAEAEAATIAVAEASRDYDSALLDLEAKVRSGDVSMTAFRATLARWTQEGRLTAGQAATVRSRLEGVAGAAEGIPSSVSTTVVANTARAMEYLRQVGLRIQQLDGSTITVNVNARATSTGRIGGVPIFHSGGIVPEYMAAGGFGPRGTDTVPAWLTPGEMVLNAGQQAELWAMANGRRRGGGGHTFIFNGPVAGEREFVRIVRDELQRGGFAGLAR